MATSKKQQGETRAERLQRNLTNQKGKTIFKKYTQELKGALPSGKTYLRILPWDPKDTSAPPMISLGTHFIAGEVVPCLNVFHEGGGHCPVCAWIEKKGRGMEKEEFWAWKQETGFGVRKRFAVWGLDLSKSGAPAKIYELPAKVGNMVSSKFNDEEDEPGGCWWKPGKIYDFKIVKVGSGLTTNYDKSEVTTKYENVKTSSKIGKLVDLEEIFTMADSADTWKAYIKKLLQRVEESELTAEDSSDTEVSSGEVSDDEVSSDVKSRSKKKAKPAEEDSEEEVASDDAEEASEAASEDAEEEASEEEASEEAPKKKTKKSAAEEDSEEEEEVESDDAEEESEAEEAESEEEEAPAKKKTAKKKTEQESEEEVESEDAEEEDDAEEASEESESEESESEEEVSEDEEEASEDAEEEESEEAPAKKAPAKKKKVTAEEMRKKLKAAKKKK